MKKKIVFISPLSGIYDKLYKTIPLPALSALREVDLKRYDVLIIDQKIQGWDYLLKKTFEEDVLVYCVSAFTGYQSHFGALISKKIKEKRKNSTILWGGVHACARPIQTLNEKYIDIVCVGEGEKILPEIIKRLDKKESLKGIFGVYFKDRRGKIIYFEKSPPIDISKLKDPPYDLLDMKAYIQESKENDFYIEGARGCIYNCSFCYNQYYSNKKWRFRDEKEIFDNIIRIYKSYGLKNYFIIDDSFFVNKSRVFRFAKMVYQENFKRKPKDMISFSCEANLTHLLLLNDNELLELAKSGLKWVAVGIESGSERIRKLYNKEISQEDIINFNKRIAKYPIKIRYNFITGSFFEKRSDLKKSIALISRLLKDNNNCLIQPMYITVPYPNTTYFNQAIKAGLKEPKRLCDWSFYDSFRISKLLPWFSPKKRRLYEFLMYSSYLIDDKIKYYFSSKTFGKVCSFLLVLYRPFVRLRFKYLFPFPNIEVFIGRFLNYYFLKSEENVIRKI
ncbi:MAG TPA: radical SAM protein [Candidatus Woesearchaeota archaeon]|nr:radical SAM protein [Candidatus Woesearchaeota archaeon]